MEKYDFDQRKRLGRNQCPHCGSELDVGFGMAGGGYGAYTYCPAEDCGKYFDKTQEHFE
jgi:uncharacterized protein (UPF0212 family)